MTKPKHERTRDIQKSLETRARTPLQHFDSRKYVQHNVNLGDGLGPILELMDSLPADRTKVEALRSFEDGDYSIAHLDYELGDWGPMVGFEVHRWENDRIVEHWDNLQSRSPTSNSSGRTMIDGAREVTDLELTETHKALVERFTKDVLIARKFDLLESYVADNLIQHNPQLADGTDALLSYLNAGSNGDRPIYRAARLLLGQGNFVLAASEGEVVADGQAAQPAAFYDLYRLENGRIVEHWDVIEIIPPRDTWQNDNGKF